MFRDKTKMRKTKKKTFKRIGSKFKVTSYFHLKVKLSVTHLLHDSPGGTKLSQDGLHCHADRTDQRCGEIKKNRRSFDMF